MTKVRVYKKHEEKPGPKNKGRQDSIMEENNKSFKEIYEPKSIVNNNKNN